MIKIPASKTCYSSTKRDVLHVPYIVIHNTGNKRDSARANGEYFKNTKDNVGAHFIIDQTGEIIKSTPLCRSAWAVGGKKYTDCKITGGGKYYGIVTNANSVSIELCDIVDREPTPAMIRAIKKVIKEIRKTCPNAKTIVRHFDVNGKHCPVRYMDSKEWKKLVKKIGE